MFGDCPMTIQGDLLRQAMRRWTTGVCVVTSRAGDQQHGMTVNSFTSVSLEPPMVTVTLAHKTRTYRLVSQSGVFGVTILNQRQREIADLFSGKVPEDGGRFEKVETFVLSTGAPFLSGGLAFLDCLVRHVYAMASSTLFVGEVLAVQHADLDEPLIYHNRLYHRLAP